MYLDFSFDMEGIDRRSLLEKAARELDACHATLGVSGRKLTKSMEGALVRSMMEDVARFGPIPTVYKITGKDFIGNLSGLPFRFVELTKDYNFYWLQIPLFLYPRAHWAFNRLEIYLQFSAKEPDPCVQPKIYQIFPSKKFVTLLETSFSLEVGLDENFELAARTSRLTADLGYARGSLAGGMGAKVGSRMSFIVGPLYHRSKKVVLDHSSAGTNEVFWRLEDTEFFENDDPQLAVIVEIPRTTRDAIITARMQAARCFAFANANLQQSIQYLPEAIQTFFKHGAPLEAQTLWDITTFL